MQKVKESDQRTLIDHKGAATLFIKWCSVGVKNIFATAFRNGTEGVATAVSTLHRGQEWEGIVMKPKELKLYNQNKQSLIPYFFEKVEGIPYDPPSVQDSTDSDVNENDSVTAKMKELLEETIEPFTLRQGKS